MESSFLCSIFFQAKGRNDNEQEKQTIFHLTQLDVW